MRESLMIFKEASLMHIFIDTNTEIDGYEAFRYACLSTVRA